jgi:D-lactate dehydrogenase
LKLITTRSTGFDHIDLEKCKKQGITVCNVPSYGENTVAEHTFALILSLSRNMCKACIRRFEQNFSIEGLEGFDLKGKTIGVIGTGQIGLHVIRIAKGFGMNVLAYDVRQNKLLSEVLGFEYVALEDLLARSDVITLHVPYMKATHHLMNKDTFKLVKKGAILINTARGSIVDTEALIEALDNKILAGAGLDVFEGEEVIKEEKQLLYDPKNLEVLNSLVKDHILLSKDNVVFTPHIAFYSKEALERILETTVENIVAFVSGKPQNVVQPNPT